MDRVISFFVAGECRPWRPARTVRLATGKSVSYSERGMKRWQESVWGQAMRHAPAEPWRGPVRANLTFRVRMPRSWPQWRKEASRGEPCVQRRRRDVGNLAKAALDTLEGPFFENDGQVWEILCRKVWAPDAAPEGFSVALTLMPEQPTRRADLDQGRANGR